MFQEFVRKAVSGLVERLVPVSVGELERCVKGEKEKKMKRARAEDATIERRARQEKDAMECRKWSQDPEASETQHSRANGNMDIEWYGKCMLDSLLQFYAGLCFSLRRP